MKSWSRATDGSLTWILYVQAYIPWHCQSTLSAKDDPERCRTVEYDAESSTRSLDDSNIQSLVIFKI
jgi:hypothetical protein